MRSEDWTNIVREMTPLRAAFEGASMGDALAMPVHWYYDTEALKRDYGTVDDYVAPKNPHSGSILWRSTYQPVNEKADILRGQAKYWGQKGVHYHQFLKAGENTLNFQLARELYEQVKANGAYDVKLWAETYISCMLEPGWHNDTYAEEYHRAYFNNYARGVDPLKCGIDDKHIGGLSCVPALVAALEGVPQDEVRTSVKAHVSLTHKNKKVLEAADLLVTLLFAIAEGQSLRDALKDQAHAWLSTTKAATWVSRPDTEIVGGRFSSACYIEDAMPGALYLAWKYEGNLHAGLVANTMVGGDNCHRAAVVGSLLAARASAS